jgi:eukaryotic-like serine/threonine-protein kinase
MGLAEKGDAMGQHSRADPDAGHAALWAPARSGQSTESTPSLPGYRDFVPIARSQTSEVYRALQAGVDRPVAVKILLFDDHDAIARFDRELEITVKLGRQHPHIVTVIDAGTTADGRPCIVMEHYDRGSLHDRLVTDGPLSWEEVLAAGTAVADALSFAHRHGVLHRDVKPQNILVLPTSYVVADFGIARRIDTAPTASVEWFSLRHASPQTLDGLPPAVSDDIWSLGSTMFTLLDGEPPFALGRSEEDTGLAYLNRVRAGGRRVLNRPDIPPGLVAVIECCLQREAADRFPDAAALHAALTKLAAQAQVWAPPEASPFGKTAGRAGGVSPESAGQVLEGSQPLVEPAARSLPPIPSLSASALPSATQGRAPTPPALSTGRGAFAPAPPPTAGPKAASAPPPTAGPKAASAPSPTAGPKAASAPPPPMAAPTALPGPRTRRPPPAPGAAAIKPQPGASQSVPGRAVPSYVDAHTLGDATVGPRESRPTPTAASERVPAQAGRRRRKLLACALALLIGALSGIIGAHAAGLGQDDAHTSSPAGVASAGLSPAPAGRGAAVPGSSHPTPTKVSRVNPAVAPELTDITAIDSSVVRLRWQDKSGGRARFVVVRYVEDTGQTTSYVVPGNDTRYEVSGLDPATAPYCFYVIALTDDENGLSDRRCVSPPG